MSSPTVSVIIPTYNSEGLVLETIRSALASSLDNIEVIVVNDGSNDHTSADVAAIADTRVVLIEQSNQGIGAARNRGIDAARGEYIAFLDHDDLWDPDYLEVQVGFLRNNLHLACAICQWSGLNDAAERGLAPQIKTGPLPDVLHALSRGELVLMSACLLVRSAALLDVRYPTQRRVMEDVPFYIQLFQRVEVGVSSLQPLMHYRRHVGNASADASYFMSGAFRMLEMHSEGQLNSTGSLEYAAFVCRQACRKLAQQGDIGAAWRTYFAVLSLQWRLQRWKFMLAMPVEISYCLLMGRRSHSALLLK
jgi:glycosyltransferase involved in cell wall biosynthesis